MEEGHVTRVVLVEVELVQGYLISQFVGGGKWVKTVYPSCHDHGCMVVMGGGGNGGRFFIVRPGGRRAYSGIRRSVPPKRCIPP